MDMAENSGPARVVCDSARIAQGIDNLARAVLTRHPDPRGLALVGIHSGGDLLIRRVEKALSVFSGQSGLELDKGLLDIGFYRDDWSRLTQVPALRASNISFAVDERHILLVDDVIFTGRTARSALEGLFSLGRPARVEMAVLVDRGHREFPIEPEYVGIYLATELHQSVNVFLHDDSSQDTATLEDNKYQVRQVS